MMTVNEEFKEKEKINDEKFNYTGPEPKRFKIAEGQIGDV